jgi:hypothetical protein
MSQLLVVVHDEDQDMDTRCIAVQAIGALAQSRGLDEVDRKICVPPLAKILKRRPEVPPPEEEEEEPAEAEEEDEEATEAEEEEEALPEEPAPVDTEVELRIQCVLTLGLLHAPQAVEALLESTDDTIEPSALVRSHACTAITDLPDLPADDTEAALMGDKLLDALEDSAADVRMHAAMALATHTDFRSEAIDNRINDALKAMAQELIEEGEPFYWAREAARVACNKRHVALQETETSDESSS